MESSSGHAIHFSFYQEIQGEFHCFKDSLKRISHHPINPIFVLHKKTFKMKILLIFALVFATSSSIVNADAEDAFFTILNGIGSLVEDLGQLLQNPEKLKKFAKQFVDTLKHLGREAKEKLETLLEDNPRIIEKLENAPKWSKEKLEQELDDDVNFAQAYALIKEDANAGSPAPATLGLTGFLAMSLFLLF